MRKVVIWLTIIILLLLAVNHFGDRDPWKESIRKAEEQKTWKQR